MNIGIIGTGAIACLFAARLAPIASPFLVGHWAEQINAIRAGGLTLLPLTEGATPSTVPIAVYQPHESLPLVERVLVLVKSGQTANAAAITQHLLTPSGLAFTLQNGLGNVEILARTLGAERVSGGSTAQGAVIVRPGVVQHTGNGLTYLADGADSRPLAELFNQAGITTHLVPNLESVIWGKLIVNAAINPLTALLRVPNGFLAHDPIARLWLTRIVQEAAQVAQANSITLPYPDPVIRVLEVAQATTNNQSSMLQDVQRGVPTENETISGAIVRYGFKANCPTPLNSRLYQLIQAGASSLTPTQLAQALQNA